MENGKRLQSLDVLRGLTVAGMILVNNGWGESFEMLRHSAWNGLTPCDLVFPFFLFMVGISCYLSLSKTQFRPSATVLRRILKRTVLLFAIGVAIHWVDGALDGDWGVSHLRVMAVLQRIALCYCAASLFALYVPHRLTLPVAAVLLAAYGALLVVGNGYVQDPSVNILAQADLSVFGYDHIYHKSAVDPEGLLGTIPSIAHVLLGFYCGRLIKLPTEVSQKALSLFAFGTVLVVSGWLLSYGLPLNKRVWSPSYVLVTCGLATLLLALLISLETNSRPATLSSHLSTLSSYLTTFFLIFGVNALALYVSSELLAILLGHWGVSEMVYNGIHTLIPVPKLASLCYAAYFVLLNFAIGYALYRKQIYIKL